MTTRQTFGAQQAARARKLPGWTAQRQDKGYRIVGPDGKFVLVHMTPGDNRAEKNYLAELRRIGLDAAEAHHAGQAEVERKRRIREGVASAARATAKAQRQATAVARAVGRFAMAEPADLDWILAPHEWPDVRRMIITPDVAEKLLVVNTHNRPTSNAEVLEWEQTLNDHRHRFTHEGIAFDTLGRLHDGQHRLIGCVRTGVAIDVYVFVGMDPESFPFINKGRKRTTADDLSVEGTPNATNAAAMLRILYLYDHVAYALWRFTRVKSDQVAPYLATDGDEIQYAIRLTPRWHRQTGMITSLGAVGVYLLRRANRHTALPDVDEWLYGLQTGENIGTGDARATLLRLFLKNPHPERDRAYQLAMFLKAWQHHVESNGETSAAVMQFRQGSPMPDVAVLDTGSRGAPRKAARRSTTT